MHSDFDRETVFLATSCPLDKQTTQEARRLVLAARGTLIRCADCGHRFPAVELDGSTMLCEECYDIAGMENEVQDGLLSQADFEAYLVSIGRLTSREPSGDA